MTLLLKNAHIVDGSGAEPFRGDILVHDDIISAIGTIPKTRAHTVIDCQGSYVTPGIIDPFGTTDHYLDILRSPTQEHYLEYGVTTVIGGHDGISLAPLLYGDLGALRDRTHTRGINVDWYTHSEFMARLARIKPGVNFGTLVGYQTVRDAVHANGGALSKREIDVIITLLGRALSEGAFGISFGPTPIARTELTAVATLLHAYPGRALAYPGIPDASTHKILASLAMQHDVRVLLTHVAPPFANDAAYASLEHHMGQWEKAGYYVIVPPSEFITVPAITLLPDWATNEGREMLQEKLHDSWLRGKIAAATPSLAPAEVKIAQAPHHTALAGTTLAHFMKDRNLKDAKEGLLALLEASDFRATLHLAHPHTAHIAHILAYPNLLFGSEQSGSYRNHWRNIDMHNGFLPRIHEAEDRGVLAVAELIATITHKVARCYGIEGRGLIREGMRADLMGFKNKSIRFVAVNGTVAYQDGVFHESYARHGKPLTHIPTRT